MVKASLVFKESDWEIAPEGSSGIVFTYSKKRAVHKIHPLVMHKLSKAGISTPSNVDIVAIGAPFHAADGPQPLPHGI